MKKIILTFAWIAAVIGLSSCSETWDNNPRLVTHDGVIEDNFLNVPELQDQYVEFSPENQNGSLVLTCSQPNVGYAAVMTYKVQMSLTEDFAKYEEISQAFYDCANINPLNKDLAASLEKLYGVKTEADIPEGYNKVFFRLSAYLEQSASNTQFVSNVVSFNHIGIAPGYLAIWVEGQPSIYYLRGGMNNWEAPAEWNFLTGETENTWMIKDVTIAKGTEFKAADAQWAAFNAGNNGNPIKIGEPYELEVGSNPGNLSMPEDFTGNVQLSLEKGKYYLTFIPA